MLFFAWMLESLMLWIGWSLVKDRQKLGWIPPHGHLLEQRDYKLGTGKKKSLFHPEV